MHTQFIYNDQSPCSCGLKTEYLRESNGWFATFKVARFTGIWQPAFIFYN
jgi:hypothetical protein